MSKRTLTPAEFQAKIDALFERSARELAETRTKSAVRYGDGDVGLA